MFTENRMNQEIIIPTCNHLYSGYSGVCDFQESSRIQQERKISRQAFAPFIRHSIKCSGDPDSTLVFELGERGS